MIRGLASPKAEGSHAIRSEGLLRAPRTEEKEDPDRFSQVSVSFIDGEMSSTKTVPSASDSWHANQSATRGLSVKSSRPVAAPKC